MVEHLLRMALFLLLLQHTAYVPALGIKKALQAKAGQATSPDDPRAGNLLIKGGRWRGSKASSARPSGSGNEKEKTSTSTAPFLFFGRSAPSLKSGDGRKRVANLKQNQVKANNDVDDNVDDSGAVDADPCSSSTLQSCYEATPPPPPVPGADGAVAVTAGTGAGASPAAGGAGGASADGAPAAAAAPDDGPPRSRTSIPESFFSVEFSNLMKKTPVLLVLDDEFVPCKKKGPADCKCQQDNWDKAVARTWRANYDTGKVIPGTEKVVIRSPYQVIMPRETFVVETPHAPNAAGEDVPNWTCNAQGTTAWNARKNSAAQPWFVGGSGGIVLPLPDDSPLREGRLVKDDNGVPLYLDPKKTKHGDPLWVGLARFEWNSNTEDGVQWLDLSAVEGTNMHMYLQYYEWDGSGYKPLEKRYDKACTPNLETCPKKAKGDPLSAPPVPAGYTCTSPKFWFKEGTNEFKMAGCPAPASNKPDCHTWWVTNEKALSWKKWLYGVDDVDDLWDADVMRKTCDAYAWAYNEKVCKKKEESWDQARARKCAGEKWEAGNYNPESDNPLAPLIAPKFTKGSKFSMFFTKVMGSEKQENDASKPAWKRKT